MSALRVVVVGASVHAKVIIDLLEQMGEITVIGALGDDVAADQRIGEMPVLGGVDSLAGLVADGSVDAVIVGIGDNSSRARLVARVRDDCGDLPFVTAVHPSAVIGSRAVIGPGAAVMAGAVIGNDAHVGAHAIVNTRASLDHDGVLGEFASLAPNVATGGSVRIGAFSAIGIGTTIVHEVSVGDHTVVGAGSVVLGDLPDHVVAYGTPARTVRSRAEGDRYL